MRTPPPHTHTYLHAHAHTHDPAPTYIRTQTHTFKNCHNRIHKLKDMTVKEEVTEQRRREKARKGNLSKVNSLIAFANQMAELTFISSLSFSSVSFTTLSFSTYFCLLSFFFLCLLSFLCLCLLPSLSLPLSTLRLSFYTSNSLSLYLSPPSLFFSPAHISPPSPSPFPPIFLLPFTGK